MSLRNWLDPEPYQNPTDSRWRQSSAAGDGVQGSVPRPERTRWFTHKKHRKMAKLQLSDALEMRGAVMLCLAGLLLFGLFAVGWGLKRAFGLRP